MSATEREAQPRMPRAGWVVLLVVVILAMLGLIGYGGACVMMFGGNDMFADAVGVLGLCLWAVAAALGASLRPIIRRLRGQTTTPQAA